MFCDLCRADSPPDEVGRGLKHVRKEYMPQDLLHRIGAHIARKRQMLMLTKRHVADAIGMDPTQYGRLERGQVQKLYLMQLVRLTQVLRTSGDYLLGLSEDPGYDPLRDGEEQAALESQPAPTTASLPPEDGDTTPSV